MTEDTKEIVDAITGVKCSIDEYRVMADRISALEGRIHGIDTDLIKYRNFVDKTSGIFTRAGFYCDAAVLWIKAKFKK